MKTCKQCGAELNDNVLFCTKCGTKVEAQGGAQDVNMNFAFQGQNNQQNVGGGYVNTNPNAYQQYSMPVDHMIIQQSLTQRIFQIVK